MERSRIEENWAHIKELEAKAKDKTGDPEAGFNATSFWFDALGRRLMIPIMYRTKYTRKGEEVFSKSYKDMMVIAEYCPFTGKPLYKEV